MRTVACGFSPAQVCEICMQKPPRKFHALVVAIGSMPRRIVNEKHAVHHRLQNAKLQNWGIWFSRDTTPSCTC